MSGALLQFVGSLVAILALAGIAKWLGLGGEPRIQDEAHAKKLADEVVSGFDASEIAIGQDGSAALLRDKNGRTMVLRRHGNKFVGRILGADSHLAIAGEALQVSTSEQRFGVVALKIANPQAWLENAARAGAFNA